MTKRVLAIGNCGFDHRAIAGMIESRFDATVIPAATWEDAVELLRAQPFALILVNRKLDADYSDGLDVIKQLKQDPQFSALPVMMITNFSEHQQQAMEAGAVEGFGKQALHAPNTRQLLEPFLG